MNKKQIFQIILNNHQLIDKYKVNKLGLFGSYVHDRQNSKSDIDFLVEFKETPDLFDFYDMKSSMEKMFQTKVDLCTVDALKPTIKNEVLNEVEWVEGL